MRTTAIGWCTPAIGVTPGMRRPVRMITLPSIASRRMRFGRADVVAPSGVTVAALMPEARRRASRPRPRGRPRCRSRAGSRATGRSARARSASPTTSGSSTRSACSSSSCPVSSPSRTMIVSVRWPRASKYPGRRRGYLTQRCPSSAAGAAPGRRRRRLPRRRARGGAQGRLLPPGARRAVGDPGRALGAGQIVPGEPDDAPRALRPVRRELGDGVSCSCAIAASTGSATPSAASSTCTTGPRAAAATRRLPERGPAQRPPRSLRHGDHIAPGRRRPRWRSAMMPGLRSPARPPGR